MNARAANGSGNACRRIGIVIAAVAFLAGVVAVQWLPFLPPWYMDAGVALVAIFVGIRWPRLLWLALVLLGACWACWRGGLAMQARLPAALEKQDIDVTGVVRDLPDFGSTSHRFMFDVDKASLAGHPVPLRGLVRVAWYGAPDAQPVPCSRWRFRLRLKRPRSLLDPGGYDSERTALEKGIVATGYVRAKAGYRELATPWCVDRWRADVSAAIARAIDDPRDTHLLQSLAVGDTHGLTDDDWEVARRNGITHLLAISGFHVGVAAMFGAGATWAIWWLLPWLGRRAPRKIATAFGAFVMALAYGAMAGFGLPTVRTLLMIAVVVVAHGFRRHTSGAQTLSLALLVILSWDPLAVLSAGFWLSFAGVALLMLILERPRTTLEHGRALGLTQLLMTVGLLPLTVWLFGQASLAGGLSNLVAVPVVSLLIVPLAILGVLVLPLSVTLAQWSWQLAAWFVHGLWWLLEQVAAWPAALWFAPLVSLSAVVLAMIGACWLFMPRGMPGRWLGLAMFLPLLFPVRAPIADGAFRLWVLDVGQGLSVIVRTRNHVLVYDAGARYPSGFDLGRVIVVPALRALGVDDVDTLMISHGDNDHAGGAGAVLEAFPAAMRLSGEPARVGLGMEQCHAGQAWRRDGVVFRILSPSTSDLTVLADNDRSCVLLVRGKGGQALLTGDISDGIGLDIVGKVPADRPLVLVVPHHGSASSSGEAFVASLDPLLALDSAGWLNRYHHPAAMVVARYVAAGAVFFNTATSGAIRVDVPVSGLPHVARQWRHHHRHYWRE